MAILIFDRFYELVNYGKKEQISVKEIEDYDNKAKAYDEFFKWLHQEIRS
jgi:hypothetical protein